LLSMDPVAVTAACSAKNSGNRYANYIRCPGSITAQAWRPLAESRLIDDAACGSHLAALLFSNLDSKLSTRTVCYTHLLIK